MPVKQPWHCCLRHAGCLFHNHTDVLCPGGLGVRVCSDERSSVDPESSYVAVIAEGMCAGNLPREVNSGKMTNISAQICKDLAWAWCVRGGGWGLSNSPES